jgi:branched-chain amino acid transport system substrate-binding protein
MKPNILATLAATVLLAISAQAYGQAKISDGVVKLGVLTDMSGPYADNNGPGSVLAAQMAVDDFGGKVLGAPIEVIFADNQNKPDVGVSIARQWIDDQHVDALVDIAASNVGIAVGHLAQEKNRVVLNSGSSSTRITNEDCNAVTAHWTYDTYALGNGTAAAITQRGGNTWYFITADYVFGHSLQADATKFVEKNGGKVIGSVLVPFPGTQGCSTLIK